MVRLSVLPSFHRWETVLRPPNPLDISGIYGFTATAMLPHSRIPLRIDVALPDLPTSRSNVP